MTESELIYKVRQWDTALLQMIAIAVFLLSPCASGTPVRLFHEQNKAYVNLSSDQQLDRVLGYVLSEYPDHLIRYIASPDDFHENHLLSRPILENRDKVSLLTGRLFSNESIILIIDYRQMTVPQVAELNGLLDETPAYNESPLSDSVSILAIVDEQQLSEANPENIPGSDFWRRIDGIRQRFEAAEFQPKAGHCSFTLSEYLAKRVWHRPPPFKFEHLQRKQLEFANTNLLASEVLTGGLELNDSGELATREAALAEQQNTLFVLNDAPWDDVGFKVQLANTLIRRGVETNDQCLALPPEFHLLATTTPAEQLSYKLSSLVNPAIHQEGNWLPLNQRNFDLIFNALNITNKHLRKTIPSERMQQLQASVDGIEVTSSLSTVQWQKLIHFLSAAPHTGHFPLRIRDPQQPFTVPDHLFRSTPRRFNERIQRAASHLSTAELKQAEQNAFMGQEAYIEVITPQTDTRELFERILMTSGRQRLFERHPTDLSRALRTGKPIIIKGLESNPEAQQMLESLLLTPPLISLQGKTEPTGNGDIKIQWNDPSLAQSPLWREWLQQKPDHSGPDLKTTTTQITGEITKVDWDHPDHLHGAVSQALLNHPLTYLEGPAGSGKSHIAHKTAKNLSGQNPVFTLTMGPDTRMEDLLGEQVLRSIPDISGTQIRNDHETEFADGPLLQWARHRSANNDPVIFIADEGNLLNPGLQQLLTGLLADPPFLSANGYLYPLTPQHRLIITGNPPSMAGRHLIPELTEQATTIEFSAMSQHSLTQHIILPFLSNKMGKMSNDLSHTLIAEELLKQLKSYELMLPGYHLSARDILDVLSRFRFYLGLLTGQSSEIINQTIGQALHDSLSGQIQPEPAPPAASSAVLRKQDAFTRFYQQLGKQNSRVHLSNASTQSLAWRIWLELERIARETSDQQPHAGHHGMVIEGPAGRGKDIILNGVIQQWRKNWQQHGLTLAEPIHITAGFNNWDTLKNLIIEAKTQGRILIVPELNLIPTHYLEGVLNDILTGEAAPGFFIFATVNPAQYSGRHTFSAALANRFTQLTLAEYTLDDLEDIASNLSSTPYVRDIPKWHHQLVTHLKHNDAAAVPAVMKMISFLKQIEQERVDGLESVRQRFMTTYRLYTQNRWQPESSANNTLPPMATPRQHGANEQPDQSLPLSLTEKLAAFIQKLWYSSGFGTPETKVAIDNDVIYNPEKSFGKIQKVFFGHNNPAVYRSSVWHMQWPNDGTVYLIAAPYQGYPIESVPGDLVARSEKDQHFLGEQPIITGKKAALTSLFPREKLLALSSDSTTPVKLQVEYDPYQGRYFVTAESEETIQTEVKVQFIIEKVKNSYPLAAFPPSKRDNNRSISDSAKERITDFFNTHPEIQQQLNINPDLSVNEQVERIMEFTRNFGVSESQPEDSSSGSGIDALLFLLKYQMGSCRHRSYVAAMLGAYFDIPVRLISNDLHMFVEFSTDGGFNWSAYDAGGYPAHYEAEPPGIESLRGSLKQLLELTGMTDSQNQENILQQFDEPNSDYGFNHIRDVIQKIESLPNPDDKHDALGYFGKLLLDYNISPDKMEAIPYLLDAYPEYQPALVPWMRKQHQRARQKTMTNEIKDFPLTRKVLNGSPFAELEQQIRKPSSGFRQNWKHHPPGQLKLSRLLENKPAFASVSEQQQFERRRVIFNVSGTPLNNPEKMQRYRNIIARKFGSEGVDDIVEQESIQFTYHLDRTTGLYRGNAAIIHRINDVYRWSPLITESQTKHGFSSKKNSIPMGARLPRIILMTPEPSDAAYSWLWDSTMTKTSKIKSDIPLQLHPEWFPETLKEWQDAVVIDDEMLDRLFCHYLESLPTSQ